MSGEIGATGMVVLRTDDGAWYELSTADLERARITEAATLAEARKQAATGGNARETAPAKEERSSVVLSEEALAPHRVGAARAAALDADDEVAGYAGLAAEHGSLIFWGSDHRQITVRKAVDISQPGGPIEIQFVPVLVLATAPSARFGGDKPYLR